MNLGESVSISNKKENELIKKKDPTRTGILWWASQNFTCQEMLEKWYPKWDDPRSCSINYRHILYYLSRYSRHDMLDILITRDPKLNLKVSYDGELLPLNAAVWTKKREHIEIIKTIDINYKFLLLRMIQILAMKLYLKLYFLLIIQFYPMLEEKYGNG